MKEVRRRSFEKEHPYVIFLKGSSFKLKNLAGRWAGADGVRIVVHSSRRSLARLACFALPLLLFNGPTLADDLLLSSCFNLFESLS